MRKILSYVTNICKKQEQIVVDEALNNYLDDEENDLEEKRRFG